MQADVDARTIQFWESLSYRAIELIELAKTMTFGQWTASPAPSNDRSALTDNSAILIDDPINTPAGFDKKKISGDPEYPIKWIYPQFSTQKS